MKISLIVPCSKEHLLYIEECLDSILEGKRIPDEILVYISPLFGVEDVEKILSLRRKYPSVDFYGNSDPKFYAYAKNEMVRRSSGDLIISLDADDIQHKDRIEFIENQFLRKDILHLNHSFVYYDQEWEEIEEGKHKEWDSLTLTGSINAEPNGAYGFPHCRRTQDGAVSFKREVFDKVQWDERLSRGADKKFCFSVLREFDKSLLVDAPLVKWRKRH